MTAAPDADAATTPTTVYRADSRSRSGLKEAFEHAAGSIIAYRWQILQSFKRDFLHLSTLTRWGAFWNYVLPLTPLGVYVMLTSIRVFPKFGGVEPVVYITMGVTLWYLFSGLMKSPISILESDFRTLARTNMPMAPAFVAGASQLAFETCLRLFVVTLLFAFLQGPPAWTIVLALPLLLLACIFFTGVGIVLGLFNLAYRDISKIVSILLTYGIFFSGVIFPLPGGQIAAVAHVGNPFYVFIENIRAMTIGGPIENPMALAAFSVGGLVFFSLAILLSYRSELRLRGLA
jgi:ABC-type polysaccharide/polyol phosphate export permease